MMALTARKNHYTHARGKFRKSARLSRSFGGTKEGIFDQHILQYQH